jgi:hypothetical protein
MHDAWEIIGGISNIEIIAVDSSIRILEELKEEYGDARWRKLKGIAVIRFANGTFSRAELHWYEANGIGRKRMKIKRLLY